VVKLFNAIQQAQANAIATAEEKKGMRGSGKPRLPAPDIEKKSRHKKKDNILGRGRESKLNRFSLAITDCRRQKKKQLTSINSLT
jgi:hypothetical protein